MRHELLGVRRMFTIQCLFMSLILSLSGQVQAQGKDEAAALYQQHKALYTSIINGAKFRFDLSFSNHPAKADQRFHKINIIMTVISLAELDTYQYSQSKVMTDNKTQACEVSEMITRILADVDKKVIEASTFISSYEQPQRTMLKKINNAHTC